ncbi:MAG: outer membrane protein assembly factor BamB family protein [Planctomycetota bacterium]
MKILFLFIVLTAPAIMAGPTSDDWPQFRGPTGQGVARNADPPLHWSQTDNVVWKKAIPGEGWSSPIVYRGSVYLTAAIVDKHGHPTSLHVLRLDATRGDILWTREAFTPKGSYPKHDKNSHASPTPMMEDGRLYAHFGHMGTACLNVHGKILWRKSNLTYDPKHGNGGSPILCDDKLIFSCDGAKDPFVVALNKFTGDVVWKVNRKPNSAPNKFSFSTPLPVDENGRKVVVSQGSGAVCAYNPDDGKEIWSVDYGSGFSVVPRPVYGHGMVFISTGFNKPNVYAIRVGGHGDVTDTHLVWKAKRGAPKTPSLLLVDRDLYCVSDNGMASCFDAITGSRYWQEKIGGSFSASPVAAHNRIYITTEKGKTFVIRANTKFKILAENDLRERALASPAVSGRALFIRTESHLYRIEEF